MAGDVEGEIVPAPLVLKIRPVAKFTMYPPQGCSEMAGAIVMAIGWGAEPCGTL